MLELGLSISFKQGHMHINTKRGSKLVLFYDVISMSPIKIPKHIKEVPWCLWASHSNEVGRVLCSLYRVQLKTNLFSKQYLLPSEKGEGSDLFTERTGGYNSKSFCL